MRTSTKLIVALATAGIAAGAGSAYTAASGVTIQANSAASKLQFIGGTLSQTSFQGTELVSSAYTRKAGQGNVVTAALFTFDNADAEGAPVSITVYGSAIESGPTNALGTTAGTPAAGVTFTCSVVSNTGTATCGGGTANYFEVTDLSRVDVTIGNFPTP